MRAIGLVAVLMCSGSASLATVVFDDPFEDGGRTQGADPFDIPWYRANQNMTLSVVSDGFAGGGSSKALLADQGDADAFKRIMGQFDAVSLNTGETLTLSFAFRSVTVTPPNNTWGFRFGLYNSNGTKISGDEGSTSYNNTPGTQESDDFGYNARIPTGTADAPDIFDEPAGDNTLGGTTAGASIRVGTPTSIGVNSTATHLISLSITRSSTTQLDFALRFNGSEVATGVDTTGIFTTFDAVYFGTGNINNFDYMLDNVKLELTPVPEPAALVPLGFAGLFLRRRR